MILGAARHATEPMDADRFTSRPIPELNSYVFSMHALDLTLPTPEENLALDEALLEEADESGAYPAGLLRLYEAPRHFVVLGYGNRIAAEVDATACAAAGIPVLRRASGGGTVLLGPGCLAYALVLPLDLAVELETITGTNRWIMERLREAFERATDSPVRIQGHTDLTIGGRKFSGNAQRRRRRSLLFHGTFLLDFDLALIARCLTLPARQPEYRGERPHGDFVLNLGLSTARAKQAMIDAWDAREPADLPRARLAPLLASRYALPEWHRRF